MTNAVLEYNEKEEPNRYGKCDKCQSACPLSAFEQPYVLNKNKCLSFNLLQDGDLPAEFQSAMENRVGDCEICQDACPWNKKHLENPLPTKLTKAFREREKTWEELFYLPGLSKLTEEEYNNSFVGRVKTGIPYETFYRNVNIALGNAEATRKTVEAISL